MTAEEFARARVSHLLQVLESGSRTLQDEPSDWLGSTDLLDLHDPKLRLRARSLTQLCKSEREKALALFGYVKRLPVTAKARTRLRTARQVMDLRQGDAVDKATLLVAMLRAVNVPARMKFATPPLPCLRGLAADVCSMPRPMLEVWIEDGWICTDTYIFDAPYMAAARQRLRDEGEMAGYGIHVSGAMLWDGRSDACVAAPDNFALRRLEGSMPCHDPAQFVRTRSWTARIALFVRTLAWNVTAPLLDRTLRGLRWQLHPQAPQSEPATSSLPPAAATRPVPTLSGFSEMGSTTAGR